MSLNELMVEFIRAHSSSIEAIFLAIHAPREFVGIELSGDEPAILRRDGTRASIKQLSTGQRTAVALAIFLVMNSALKDGPNLILFDDPVAYVDDLNVLSFLDYLRDMSFDSNRQIFFATASKKVNSLFTRKFDIFEDEFRSYELDRPPTDYLGMNVSLH